MQQILKKPLLAVGILVVVIAAAALTWYLRSPEKVSLRTASIKRGSVVATISATGTIEPVEVVDVGAQVAGQIISFGKDSDGKAIDYRSAIEAGTVLANIDQSVYDAELAVAQAQLEQDKAGETSAVANLMQAKAKLVQAEAEWNRGQELSKAKLLTGSDFDAYRANFEVAKANVAVADAAIAQAKANTVQANAAVEKAKRNLGFCTIKSPVKGVIIDRRVNIGQTVVASLNAPSLFLIAQDLSRIQIWVAVNEADIGRIKPGAPVTFTCDAFPGREFSGSVGKVRLNATMTQNVVMYTVEVNAENPENVLLPYLTANVKFVTRRDSDTLLVPNAALRWTPASAAASAGKGEAMAEVATPGKAAKADKQSRQAKQGTIWLKEADGLRSIEVALGGSDGANTSVTGEGLQEGLEVIIGEKSQAAVQARAENPFAPKVIKR